SALLASWTPPSTQGAEARTTNVVIGNAATAAASACAQARREGFAAEVLDAPFIGEARDVGQHLARHLAAKLPLALRPACLIAYGESTVSLGQDPGKGGRNQELALAAANQIAGMKGCLLVALATDGEDGPTDAAGAVVTDLTNASGTARGMRTEDYLARHDAYHYFEALGDLLKPGPTGTNVNDLVVMFAL
ncbi:MAG TPA: MOFRL family protein, partial [Anaerolineales bacterium]|nr:MOFRL family protein [Anaerolineales bacterium]